ncbi:MAG: DUF177 domain-containing protein [Thermoanaerobaculia bacterium]
MPPTARVELAVIGPVFPSGRDEARGSAFAVPPYNLWLRRLPSGSLSKYSPPVRRYCCVACMPSGEQGERPEDNMSNFIDLKKIEQADEPVTVEAILELNPADLEHDDIESISDAKIVVIGSKGSSSGEFLLQGTFDFKAEISCARCLEPVPFANTSEFAVTFRPHPSVASEDDPEIEIEEGDLDVEYYSEPQVALEQLAGEQIELALPMRIVCAESCQGLCLRCGANLNRGECGCKPEAVDDRLQALSALRDKLKKEEK